MYVMYTFLVPTNLEEHLGYQSYHIRVYFAVLQAFKLESSSLQGTLKYETFGYEAPQSQGPLVGRDSSVCWARCVISSA